MAKLRIAGLALAACFAAFHTCAAPILYRFSGTASGTLAGASFVDSPFVLELNGDTVEVSAASFGRQVPVTGRVTVAGAVAATSTSLTLMSVCSNYHLELRIYSDSNAFPSNNYLFGVQTIPDGACGLNANWTVRGLTPTIGSFAVTTGAGPLAVSQLSKLVYEAPNDVRPTMLEMYARPQYSTADYGPVSVSGADWDGAKIANAQQDVVIQLGASAGAPGTYGRFDFNALDLAPGATLTIRSGAPDQALLLVQWSNGLPPSIAGRIRGEGGNGFPPPQILLYDHGLTVHAGGANESASGVTRSIATLGGWYGGYELVNHGVIDGGTNLVIQGVTITGDGAYKGNAIEVAAYGNANNPVTPADFLANGIHLYPSSGSTVFLDVLAYSARPQVLNLMVHGDAEVSMPSQPSVHIPYAPQNNAVVAPSAVRAAGVADPMYGGGSLIVQATGGIQLLAGGTSDFAFAGAIVLKSPYLIDMNGVVLNQGWTTGGQPFQGVFLEAPVITNSRGLIAIYGNDRNWVNFSTPPPVAVRTFVLARNADGTASYQPSDTTAPHRNAVSAITAAAAAGACWVCLIDPAPFDVYAPH